MNIKAPHTLWPILGLALFFVGCQTPTPTPTQTPLPTRTLPTLSPTTRPTSTPVLDPPTLPLGITTTLTQTLDLNDTTIFGYTYLRSNGNRLIDGKGTIPSANKVEIELNGTPQWIVSGPINGNGSIWAVVFADGEIQGFHLLDEKITPINIPPGKLPENMPPLLRLERGVPSLVQLPQSDASPLTHPVPIFNTDRMAYIATNGDLVLWENGDIARLPVDALPDARILQDEEGRLLLLTGPSNIYSHGVLGDNLEARSITLVETKPEFRVVQTFSMPGAKVVEGIAPIWFDLLGDGQPNIIVTTSDEEEGAQILVFDETGKEVLAGPPIGRGFRWRHQIVVAPFDAENGLQIVDNLTPHIGGIVEFYEINDDELSITAQQPGYSSHNLGSRNLDLAVAGDFDNDELLELLIPNQNKTTLAGMSFVNGEIRIDWEIALGGVLSTNIGAVAHQDGKIIIAVGTKEGKFQIYMP